MAVPKRKTSKSKRDKRRTHDRLKIVNIVECPGATVKRYHIESVRVVDITLNMR